MLSHTCYYHTIISQKNRTNVTSHDFDRLRVKHLGIDAAREGSSSKAVKDVQYIPKSATDPLKDPKEGEHDDKQHVGGNRYAGGVSFFSCLSLALN